MPLDKSFAAQIEELLALLVHDLPGALRRLQEVLPPASTRQDEVLLLLSRYNKARQLSAAAAADQKEIEVMENAVRRDTLLLIRDLKPAEFETSASGTAAQDKPSNLLYRIPHAMPLQQETLCVVRIATDPGILVEDFRVDEHTEQRRLKKISKSMLVEISDPSGGRNFNVRPTSRSVQTIDLEGEEYTEWRIYVTPLREGQYLLELKVCVIELVDGEKEVRERVLEEQVQVLADGQSRSIEETPEKQAGTALSFADVDSPSPSAPQASTAYEAAPKRREGAMRAASLFLAFVIVGSSVGWALTPEVQRDWWMASLKGTEEAYTGFIAEHESNHEYCEKAYFRRAIVSDNPKIVRGYLEYLDYRYDVQPVSDHKERVLQKLETMELSALKRVEEKPDLPTVERFLEDYPNTTRLDDIRRIGERDPKLDAPIKQLIQTVRLQRQDTIPAIDTATQQPSADTLQTKRRWKSTLKDRPNLRESLRERVEERRE